MIPKSKFCFQTGFHGKKILHFKILVTPQLTQTTPSLLLQADKRLATEGTHWNIIDDVPDTHNMSMQWTNSRLLPLKIFKANLQSAFFRDCFFLDGFEITYDSIKGCYKSIKMNHSEILHQLMHHVTSILVNVKHTWAEMVHKAIIIICFRLLNG